MKQNGGKLILQNGIVFDTIKGEIIVRGKHHKVQRFDTATLNGERDIQVQSKLMHMDGTFAVVYMRSYNQMIIMDTKTYNSTYVQMFMLGKYDKSLFELVVSSPFSRIYKVK